ncbi:FAD-dependent monooxygenase [Pokkaliibacter sp. CJK22405]|uniref:FAD-dependent monooxygenase n=1 Tax=Pokkaliibacter sp. CJK22405 TaxID=3384615 RepID=UPI003984E298
MNLTSSDAEKVTQADIVIVGGGMVGAALTASLGDSQYKVLLLEQHVPKAYDASQDFDLRVSAISRASEKLLQSVGAWEGVLSKRSCIYRRMRVWEQEGQQGTLFDAAEIQQTHLGHIVENRLIQLSLWERLEQLSNVEVRSPAVVKRITYVPGKSLVELASGEKIEAQLLVGAEGANSLVRQAASISTTGWDYPTHVLVVNVTTAYEQQDITWQRFRPTGPEAFLPLAGNHASIVWYHRPEEVARLKALDKKDLLAELYHHFPQDLGEITNIDDVSSFPLRRQHARSYVKPGVVLVGDAAHSIHPLAGQGVNLGFADVVSLSDALKALNPEELMGGVTLAVYEQERRKANALMMNTMEMFARTSRLTPAPIKFLRSAALTLADRSGPIKQKVMKYAMGIE